MPDMYDFQTLPDGHVRLLHILPSSTSHHIECTLEHAQRAASDYVALSYCWGDSKPVADIEINRVAFSVAANLHSFLQNTIHLGRHNGRKIWIDAICINQ